MGAFQLPDSVVGDAIACLIYSFVCLLANCVLIWLIWTHHERSSCELVPPFQLVAGSTDHEALLHRCCLHCILHSLGHGLKCCATILRLHLLEGHYGRAV